MNQFNLEMYSLDQEYENFIHRVKVLDDMDSIDQNKDQKMQKSLSDANSLIIDKEMFGKISQTMNEKFKNLSYDVNAYIKAEVH